MSTDIHMMVDVYDNGLWVPMVEPIWPHGARRPGEPLFNQVPTLTRPYALFSVLADVRNRSGRRGTMPMSPVVEGIQLDFIYDMDDGGHETIDYLSEPRGIAPGVDPNWVDFASQGAIHDPTWYLASELIDYHPIWDQRLKSDGYITEEDYLALRDHGVQPRQIARSMGGDGYLNVTVEEYEAGARGEDGTSIHYFYDGGTVREQAGRAWWATLGVMTMIAPDHDKTKVRLNIAFDS